MIQGNPQSVLIIQTAFIGDVILATPLIESLNLSFPGTKIDFLLRKGNEGLFEGHPILREVLIWDKSNKYPSLLNNLGKVRSRKYDLIVNVQRFFSTGLISFFSGANSIVGFSQNPFSFVYSNKVEFSTKPGLHEVDRNLSLIEYIEGINKSKMPRLYPSADDHKRSFELVSQQRFITISPGSVWFTKQIPISIWSAFVDILPKDIAVVFLGGKDDSKMVSKIMDGKESDYIDLCGRTTFLESASIMKRAILNYSNDSAPLHIASAVNAPSCAVYGSTIPEFGFGPLSEWNRALEVKDLDCRPCGLHGKRSCPEGHFKCGLDHEPEALLKALREVISFEENKSIK